jgi:hypothetical protein
MREFFGKTLGFPLHREPGPRWVEFRVGSNIPALTEPGVLFDDPSPPIGVCPLTTYLGTSLLRIETARLEPQKSAGGCSPTRRV